MPERNDISYDNAKKCDSTKQAGTCREDKINRQAGTCREDNSKKTALVLEGGAMRGMFTAGILDVFMERKINFDTVIGVSAGATFGCNYKSRQIGRTIRYNCRFSKEWRYCGLRSLLFTGDIYGAKFCYETIPDKLDLFDIETFRKNPCRFYIVCTDVETGKPVYKELTDGGKEDVQWIRASASMPLVSKIVEIDGHGYLDGGISDSIPVRHMIEEGYGKIVVIATRPRGYLKKKLKAGNLMKPMLRKYPNVYKAMVRRPHVYNKTTAYMKKLEEQGRIYTIYPDAALDIGKTEHDPKKMRDVYRIGRKTAVKYMKEMKEYLNRK